MLFSIYFSLQLLLNTNLYAGRIIGKFDIKFDWSFLFYQQANSLNLMKITGDMLVPTQASQKCT